MKWICLPGLAAGLLAAQPLAAQFSISSWDANGSLSWANGYSNGVLTILSANVVTGRYTPEGNNYFISNGVGTVSASLAPTSTFVRFLAVDISTNSPDHYTNLLNAYGVLETVAGRGLQNDESNQWLPGYEGDWATNACLSRPHIAFGDSQGNVLIVDQRSSSVLKVTPDGRIHTFAGTHVAGDSGDGPTNATLLQLNNPNGGWLGANDVFYVLDTDNGKLRKIYTNGIMTTIFTTTPMGDGRALWVKSDESLVYFGSGPGPGLNVTTLNKWTSSAGVEIVRSAFLNLGNILGDERTGDLYITDRNANRVYRLDTNGNLVTIAGNGTQTGGGEGFPALETGLTLPRSIAFLPNGGYFLSEHSPGNRIWYVDPAGLIHRWVNGSDANNFRVGDGQWFYANPTQAKVSRVRSAIPDRFGNLIIVESNYGYVRRIRFQRMDR
jgi:hypothetical protein